MVHLSVHLRRAVSQGAVGVNGEEYPNLLLLFILFALFEKKMTAGRVWIVFCFSEWNSETFKNQ